MLVELCAGNYATYDDLVNKTSTTCCDKIIIWIIFKFSKIKTLTRKKSHYYNNNMESKWTPIEPMIKDIIVDKS
jgi:hypothetical protein